MSDTTSVIAGKELLEIAVEFQNLVTRLQNLSNKFNVYKKTMEPKNFYDGRNRENLDKGNYAVAQHLINLTDFYGLCFAYVYYAYDNMVKLDQELAKAIQMAYLEEHHDE